MRALFDVNVLLALIDQDHIFHARTRAWWAHEQRHGWASCPLTQNGFLRVISQRSYLSPRSIGDALGMLKAATARPDHEFWPDDISILDGDVAHAHLLGPKQITDVYLLALAVRHGGRFVTCDRRISHKASTSAASSNLVIL